MSRKKPKKAATPTAKRLSKPPPTKKSAKSPTSPKAQSVPPPSSREVPAASLSDSASPAPRRRTSRPPPRRRTSSRAPRIEHVDVDASTERVPDDEPTTRFLDDAEPLAIDAVEPPPSSVQSPPIDPNAPPEEVADRIRELEARLDRMIDEAARRGGPHDVPRDRPSAVMGDGRAAPSTRALPDDEDATVFDTARELLSTDFYLRKWGRLGMRNRSEEVDDFGFDPIYEQKVLPFFALLYEKYFRVDVEGAANIPDEGRCLLVANHSGTLPFDGMMLKLAVKREHAQRRDVRWLAEDMIFHFPFLGSFSNRVGAVRACQENAERLLRQDALVAVFPEGMKGIGKLFKQRYRLQRFGRGGFVKLCLRTGTPIVPVAIVGGEETNPMLFRIEYLTKALGLPYFPITPTFPLLGPVGLLPAPTKWSIRFGDPVAFEGYGPEAADDEILVGRLSERVRATIQGMLDRAVGERRSVWFG